jgi:predicted Zn finger-like uncharacterized protein
MNISCISCPARYGVPDAKLVGKRVRITCKRCGTVLLVDGSVNPPRVSSGANAGPSVVPVARTSLAPASSPAPAPTSAPKQSVEFLVVMPDDRQESADVAQVVRLYRDRQINAETLVWREGMDEWAKLWDVEEIAAAFRRMGYARPSQPTAKPSSSRPAEASYDDSSAEPATHVQPSSQPPPAAYDDDEATSVVDSSSIPFDVPLPQAGWRQATEEDDGPTNVTPSPMDLALSRSPSPAAARRASSRPVQQARPQQGARAARDAEPVRTQEAAPVRRAQTRQDARARQQGLDLFVAQAQRAAEQELAPAVEDDASRLTGARGENSVLFSLDALVRQEQQAQRPLVLPPRARTDESVLVDSSPSLPSGVVGSALTAPDFTAPVSAPPPRMTAALGDDAEYPAPKKSGGWLLPIVVILLAGAAGGAWMSGKLNPLLSAVGLPVRGPTAPSAEPAASAAPATSAEEKAPPEEVASAKPDSSAAPDASASAAASPKPPPTGVAAAGTPRPSTPRETSSAPADDAPAPKESASKPSSGGSFDVAAAKTALASAANNASSCREATGAMGNGKVSITFAPSGRPTSVAVTGDLAGTTVGSCVARLFRAVRVPAFSGDPVSVSKAFSVK